LTRKQYSPEQKLQIIDTISPPVWLVNGLDNTKERELVFLRDKNSGKPTINALLPLKNTRK